MSQKAPRIRTPIAEESLEQQLERVLEANRRLRDDFERHLASQETWNKERTLLLAMINQVPDYLFAKGKDGLFLMANKAVAQDLGYESGADLIGLNDYQMQPDPEAARKFIEDDKKVIQSNRPKLDIEESLTDASGKIQWLSTSKVPLRNDQGEVIGLVGCARNVTERKRAQDQIHYLAYHDTLTGLPNRFLFEQRLDQALAGAGKGHQAALLYLDLDRFKNVNDTLGHPAGDELIRQVAGRLNAIARSTDTVARLGGDEFAVVMADVRDSKDVEAPSRRILREISRPFDIFDNKVFVGVSVGIAISPGGRKIDSNDMLRQADIALYRAKARGRGRYEIFAEKMAVAVLESRQIEQDLREALSRENELYALYQPVFDIPGKRLVGAEALVRWDHPQRGQLAPSEFIGVAEERGLIDALGELIIRQACQTAKTVGLPWVAVNVSPIQFRSDQFADTLLRIITEAGLTPDRLQLEITEGVLLESTEGLQETMAKLRAAGVVIALDDFGTGYSSLSYLRRYNIDKLKIDRSFVMQLDTAPDMLAIVTAMVGLGRAMQMCVTAEGVETEEQAALLRKMGCDELQGFLFGRPMRASEIAALVGTAESAA